jgi:hypothetical protein
MSVLRPTISVDRQLFWFDNLFLTGISDETLCQTPVPDVRPSSQPRNG